MLFNESLNVREVFYTIRMYTTGHVPGRCSGVLSSAAYCIWRHALSVRWERRRMIITERGEIRIGHIQDLVVKLCWFLGMGTLHSYRPSRLCGLRPSSSHRCSLRFRTRKVLHGA